jgi:hypothetical protein
MITNKELLDWIKRKIEGTRLKAMHAYNRGDTFAFEHINSELKYWRALADVMEEMVEVEQNGDVDV